MFQSSKLLILFFGMSTFVSPSNFGPFSSPFSPQLEKMTHKSGNGQWPKVANGHLPKMLKSNWKSGAKRGERKGGGNIL
jgi:hypothetical protein